MSTLLIGVVIVAHAPLASALLQCATHVYGELDGVTAFDVNSDLDTAQNLATLVALVERCDQGAGVLIMTDVYGATPSNIATRVPAVTNSSVSIVAGVNLPMTLRAVGSRQLMLENLTDRAMLGGSQGITKAGSTAPQHQLLKKTDDAQARYHHQQ